MEDVIVFIYAKEHRIKALGIEESKKMDNELKSGGWKHTVTLNACTFIQHLHNDCDNIRSEVKGLSKS